MGGLAFVEGVAVQEFVAVDEVVDPAALVLGPLDGQARAAGFGVDFPGAGLDVVVHTFGFEEGHQAADGVTRFLFQILLPDQQHLPRIAAVGEGGAVADFFKGFQGLIHRDPLLEDHHGQRVVGVADGVDEADGAAVFFLHLPDQADIGVEKLRRGLGLLVADDFQGAVLALILAGDVVVIARPAGAVADKHPGVEEHEAGGLFEGKAVFELLEQVEFGGNHDIGVGVEHRPDQGAAAPLPADEDGQGFNLFDFP